jgi:hypothetical protein
MTLSYQDLMATKRTRIKATITTEHSASSYGQPVIVLPDGGALDHQSAILLNYRIESATKAERELLAKWQHNIPRLMSPAAVLGRKGGQARSEAKTRAVRENGKKGGRPRKVT